MALPASTIYRPVRGRFREFFFVDLPRNGEYHVAFDPRWNYDRYGNSLVNRIRVRAEAAESSLITKVAPIYPPEAKRAGLEGLVRLTVDVGREGRVINVRLISGDPMLVGAAADAVRQWVYRPWAINGYPLYVLTEVDVNFSLPAK